MMRIWILSAVVCMGRSHLHEHGHHGDRYVASEKMSLLSSCRFSPPPTSFLGWIWRLHIMTLQAACCAFLCQNDLGIGDASALCPRSSFSGEAQTRCELAQVERNAKARLGLEALLFCFVIFCPCFVFLYFVPLIEPNFFVKTHSCFTTFPELTGIALINSFISLTF